MTPRRDLGRDGDVGHQAIVRRVARGGALNIAASMAAAILIFLQAVMISRGASTTVAGVYFAVTSAAAILTTAALFGGGESLPRFIPLLRVQGRARASQATIRLASAITIFLALAIGAALALLRRPAGEFLSLSAIPSEEPVMLGLLIVCLPLAALALVWIAAARAMLNVWPTAVLEKVGKAGLQVAGLAVALALGSGAAGLVGAWLIPTALIAVPAYVWLRRLAARSPETDSNGTTEGMASLARPYLAYSWPRAAQSILQVLLQRLDVILLAALTSPSQAAVYALATRFVLLGQFAAASLSQVVAPYFSGLLAEGRTDASMSLAKTVTTWTTLLVWPIFLISIAEGSGILTILGGPDYASGATALALLAAGMLFASATGPVDTILLMAGRSGVSLSISAVAVAVDIGLIYALVPRLGINGAAVAWSVALVVRSGLTLLLVRRITGATTLSRSLAYSSGIALVSFLFVPFALSAFTPAGVAGTWVSIAAGCVLYVGLLIAFRGRVQLTDLSKFIFKR